MNEIYGKPENGQITEERQVGVYYRKKSLVVDGQKLTSPNTAEQLAAAGWLLRVNPAFTDEQYVDSTAILSASSYTFEVIDKTAEELQADAEVRLAAVDQAARAHIDNGIHSSAGAMIWEKSKDGKVKSRAIKEWVEAVWIEYGTRKAMLAAGTPWSESMLDFSTIGDIPFSPMEAMAE